MFAFKIDTTIFTQVYPPKGFIAAICALICNYLLMYVVTEELILLKISQLYQHNFADRLWQGNCIHSHFEDIGISCKALSSPDSDK
jgi:hypothetical protein